MLFSLGQSGGIEYAFLARSVLGLLCNPAESTRKAYSIPEQGVLADAEEGLRSSDRFAILRNLFGSK